MATLSNDRYDAAVALLLKRLVSAAGGESARLLRRLDPGAGWSEVAAYGDPRPRPKDRYENTLRAVRRHGPGIDTPATTTLLWIDSAADETPAALIQLDSRKPITSDDLSAAFDFWDVLSYTINSRARFDELTSTLHRVDSRNQLATARTSIDRTLTDCARSGGGLAALVHACAQLSGKSVTLFDRRGTVITSSHSASTSVRTPPLAAVLAACGDIAEDYDGCRMAGTNSGLARRKIVVAVSSAGDSFGYLVMDEHPTAFVAVDAHTATSTAHLLGYEYTVQKRVARVAWNARSSLARQLVRGTVASVDLAASGEYLGVDVDARRVVVYVLDRSTKGSAEGADRKLAGLVEQELGVEVLATRGREGLMLLVEAPQNAGTLTMVARVKAALVAVTENESASAIVGISTVCTAATLRRGYREAREVVLCIDRFARSPHHRVLAVDDLGPARLFLANSDVEAVHSYVDDVLGPLLTDTPGTSDLLLTLHHYFDRGRNIRATASLLDLHENTIRLRLARVHTMTGLDVAADANDQLSAQTALLLLRLRGDDRAQGSGGAVQPHRALACRGPHDDLPSVAGGG